jgi:hypothetical protein
MKAKFSPGGTGSGDAVLVSESLAVVPARSPKLAVAVPPGVTVTGTVFGVVLVKPLGSVSLGIVAGGDTGEVVAAVGSRRGGGHHVAVGVQQFHGDAADAAFTGVSRSIAVEIIENHATDRAGFG